MRTRFLSLLMLPLMAAAQSPEKAGYALSHVNVIPMTRDTLLADQTVLIARDRIQRMGRSSDIRIPANYERIDATGNYLMPGLSDMHAHFFFEQGISADYLPHEAEVMLANGVTLARIMNGCDRYKELRDRIADGSARGPHLEMMSPQFVGAWPWKSDTISPKEFPANPAAAAEAVRRYVHEGYDGIKITFFMKRGLYDSIIEAAAACHVRVAGHVGHEVGLPAALAAGQETEHLDEFMEMLLPDSVRPRVSVSGPDIWRRQAWETVDLLDAAKLPALIRRVREAGVAICPTQYFFSANFGEGQSDTQIAALPDYDFIPDGLLPARASARANFWEKLHISADRRKRWLDLRKKIIFDLWQAGVPLLCGSDSPEWYLVQGFSVHHELQALTEAGLSNYAALQTATINPCKYLGIDSRKGTVSEGKDADLLLLDQNPLSDIANTTTIRAVFRAGKLYDRVLIDEMLAEALRAKPRK